MLIFPKNNTKKLYFCNPKYSIKMERSIYKKLLHWKNRPDRKPLILLGARQVGKTYILQEFGKREFANVVYLNCQRNSICERLFRDLDVKRIVTELERYFDTDIETGKTLIIFDEVQEAKHAITSLKYFCEELNSLHVAVAGSLLGIQLREEESFPVGKVHTINMYPMTFYEYLAACGQHRLLSVLENLDWESMQLHNEKLTELLRQYFFVGGMPEAVLKYIETGNVHEVREVQREILETYFHDMSKHTKTQIHRIHLLWQSIPAQLSRENKKFFYGALRSGARSKDFELALQWLIDAGLVYRVERCKKPAHPLKFYADNNAFKLYMLDCGLLACMAEANPNMLLLDNNAFVEFKGAFTENFVLQHIKTIPNSSVFYYSKDNSTLEIDFLFQTEEHIFPIEVKAEKNVHSRSLYLFVNEDFKEQKLMGLRFSLQPHIRQSWMENIPMYAIESVLQKENKLN